MRDKQEQIEQWHNEGKMPDWIYYQKNGRSAEFNYTQQVKQMHEEIERQEAEREL